MDLLLFRFVNQFAARWEILDAIGIFLASYLGYFIIFCLLSFVALNYKKYWKMATGALTAGILARVLIVELIRLLAPVPRPFAIYQVNLLIYRSPAPSFPSGHASFFFAVSFFLFFWMQKQTTKPKNWKAVSGLFFSSTFLISMARIFCGIHWFSDMLGAVIVGFTAGRLMSKGNLFF